MYSLHYCLNTQTSAINCVGHGLYHVQLTVKSSNDGTTVCGKDCLCIFLGVTEQEHL